MDLQVVVPCFISVREICHVGNVDVLGSDMENSELNSVILCDSKIEGVLYLRYLSFETSSIMMFCMMLITDVLKTQVCATCRGCLHLGTRLVIQRNTRDRLWFPRILH